MAKRKGRVAKRIKSIAARKADVPERDWEYPPQRKIVPKDLQAILGMKQGVLRMTTHAWENVLPPPPDAPTNRRRSGRGRHEADRAYVERLDEYLGRWKYVGFSPADKTPEGQTRWEIYAPINDETWMITVVALQHDDGEHRIVTTHQFSKTRLANRLAQKYLEKRKRGK